MTLAGDDATFWGGSMETVSDTISKQIFKAFFTVTYSCFLVCAYAGIRCLRGRLGSTEAVRESSIDSYAASFFFDRDGWGREAAQVERFLTDPSVSIQ